MEVKTNTDVIIANRFSLWTVMSNRTGFTKGDVWKTFISLKEACSYCEECNVTYQIID